MLVPKQFACSCVHCRLIMKEDEGWRWLPHRLSKRQSLPTKTVLFRTTFTRTIKLNLLLLCLCYEHYPFRLLKNVKNPDAVLCVTFGALAATPNLAFGRKLPKLSICYLSCWVKWNPPTKYYWTIWHPSCKNLTVQLYKLDNWVVEIKHLSCRIQNCREYRHTDDCIISYCRGYCIRLFGQIWSVSNRV